MRSRKTSSKNLNSRRQSFRGSVRMKNMKAFLKVQVLLCVDPSSKKFYLYDLETGKIALMKKVPDVFFFCFTL